jgi:site-specific recombinase XerD
MAGPGRTAEGGRNRTVPLSDAAIATLKAHRHLRGAYVFCTEGGERLTHSMVKDVVPRYLHEGRARETHDDARAPAHLRLAPHHAGKSLEAVQELLGHESIEMTLRYSHLTPDVRRGLYRRLTMPRQRRQHGAHPTRRRRGWRQAWRRREGKKKPPDESGGLTGAGKGI